MSMEDTLARIQAEGRVSDTRHAMLQLRKILAGALCCTCGEQLGEDMTDVTQEDGDDGPRTIHKHCE